MASREINFTVNVDTAHDPEVTAMAVTLAALAPLDQTARSRVLRYLAERFATSTPGRESALPPGSTYAAPDRRCDEGFGLLGGTTHQCWREAGHVGSHASPLSVFTGSPDRPPEFAAPDQRCLMAFGLAGKDTCWRERGHAGAHANPGNLGLLKR